MNTTKFIKLYESSEKTYCKKWPSITDYLQQQEIEFDESEKKLEAYLLKSKLDPKVIRMIELTMTDNPYLVGLYESFKKNDWQLLNNVIYQNGRHVLFNLTNSSYDHSSSFWHVLNSLAANDFETIEKCFPKEFGLAKNGFPPFVVGTNLLMALWYKNEAFKTDAIEKANKMLTTKKTGWQKAIISFLLSVHKEDMDEAGVHLNEICKTSQLSELEPLEKCLCLEAHGLFNLARMLLAPEIFEKLQMPDHPSFFKELWLWQKNNNYACGTAFISYPPKMDLVNKLLAHPIPTCRLHVVEKKYVIDIRRMQSELAHSLIR